MCCGEWVTDADGPGGLHASHQHRRTARPVHRHALRYAHVAAAGMICAGSKMIRTNHVLGELAYLQRMGGWVLWCVAMTVHRRECGRANGGRVLQDIRHLRCGTGLSPLS